MGTDRKQSKWMRGLLATIAFGVAIFTQTSFAQRPVRNVSGTVSDQHRVPLKGVVVQARNLDTDGVISYVTGVDGRYNFKRLEGGTDYRIWAKVHGHRSKTKSLSIFDSSKPKTINFVISFQ